MNAFKFRNLHNLDRVLGMIRSNALWCADWRSLNDPMEGFYYYEAGNARGETRRLVNAIWQGKRGRYVCLLSARFDIATQSAYYADEFRGLALEYDLTELGQQGDVTVERVRYEPIESTFDIHQHADPARLAEMILLTKINEWRYEEEIRVLSWRKGPLRIPRGVRSVTLGHRMAAEVREVVSAYCERRDVPGYQLVLDGRGMTREPVGPEMLSLIRHRR